MAHRVVIVGAGAWGTTLAMVSRRAGRSTVLASSHVETITALRTRRMHPRSLPGHRLDDAIDVVQTVDLSIEPDDLIVIATPVQRLGQLLRTHASLFGRARIVVSVAKGFEMATLRRPSQILTDALPGAQVVVLSGPNIASEIAGGQPATAVVASDNADSARIVQSRLTSESFRIYTCDDVIGVEVGGAVKNVVAIGAGIADGLGAGHNAKASFMTRGIGEIARLGSALGANPLTFAGLSGIGDLIATCGSPASRNHQVGIMLAAGSTIEDIVAGMVETAEGVPTTHAAWQLARRHAVDTPIIDGMYRILFEGSSPIHEARQLMQRDPTHERF